MDCKDYQALLQSGRTDFDKLLRLTGDQLRLKITKALAHPKSRLVVSYGGALHNDLHPDGESAPYSFAPAVSAQVGGALVELDLYVPEYIGKDNPARKAAWYALAAKYSSPEEGVHDQATILSAADAAMAASTLARILLKDLGVQLKG